MNQALGVAIFIGFGLLASFPPTFPIAVGIALTAAAVDAADRYGSKIAKKIKKTVSRAVSLSGQILKKSFTIIKNKVLKKDVKLDPKAQSIVANLQNNSPQKATTSDLPSKIANTEKTIPDKAANNNLQDKMTTSPKIQRISDPQIVKEIYNSHQRQQETKPKPPPLPWKPATPKNNVKVSNHRG